MPAVVDMSGIGFHFFPCFSSEAYSTTDLFPESQTFLLSPTSLSKIKIFPMGQQRFKNQFLNNCCSLLFPLRPLHTIFLSFIAIPIYISIHRGTQTTSHIILRHDVLNQFFLECHFIQVVNNSFLKK